MATVFIPAIERGEARVESKWQLLLALSFGAFLTSFDAGAVNAVLPFIRRDFGCDIATVQWVLAAELLVTSGLLLVFGRLGDRFGATAVYRTGFRVFLWGCLLCNLAPTMGWLIMFRCIQGIGTAMLLANSPAVLVRHLPAAHRGAGFGIKSSCIYLGLVAGPVAGGWLAGQFGWRALFTLELPIAVVGAALATLILPPDGPAQRGRYDFAGACVWTLSLATILWMVGRNRPLDLPAAGALVVAVSAVGFAVLAAAERRSSEPILDLRCLRSQGFAASVLALAIAFTASYMLTFVLPFLLVEAWHRSSSTVGGVMAVYAMSRSSIAWLSGRCSDRVDARWFTIPGLLLLAASEAAISYGGESGLLVCLLLAGLGFGCFVAPNNSVLMGSVPPELRGTASGILATARTVGMTIGVALAGAILSSRGGTLAGRASLAFGIAALIAVAAAIASCYSIGTKAGRQPASPIRSA